MGSPSQLRCGYAPRSSLLPLYDTTSITGLGIPDRSRESVDPKRAEWPKMPLGMLAGQEPRYLHFFADADGVHGMIAGSTGSGKSELLMTMILFIFAIKYDPTMVNFVLVDFKGGAALNLQRTASCGRFRHQPARERCGAYVRSHHRRTQPPPAGQPGHRHERHRPLQAGRLASPTPG